MTPVAQVQRSSNSAWISDSLRVKIIKRDLGFLEKEKSYSNRNTNRPSRACKHKERRRRMKEAKKPLNRRIPRAAERGERSRKAEGGEWSLPNGHLPFRRTSAAGSMAAPHFHDRVPPSLCRSPRRCIECVHPCVLPLAARTRSTRSSPPRRRPASSALVRRARISNLFPREGNNGGDDGGG